MERRNFTGYLDALIDQDGFKTDLTVSIPRNNLLLIGGVVLGTVALSAIAWFSIRHLYLKN